MLSRASSPRRYHTSYRVRVPRPARSFHASFRPHLAVTPWRFPCPSAPRTPGRGTFTHEHDSMHGTHARAERRGSVCRVRSSAWLATGRCMGAGAVDTAKHRDTNQQDQDDNNAPKHLHPAWCADGGSAVGPLAGVAVGVGVGGRSAMCVSSVARGCHGISPGRPSAPAHRSHPSPHLTRPHAVAGRVQWTASRLRTVPCPRQRLNTLACELGGLGRKADVTGGQLDHVPTELPSQCHIDFIA